MIKALEGFEFDGMGNGKTLYRARLLAGSEDHAVRGCRRLEAQKIFCSPVEIGTWSGTR